MATSDWRRELDQTVEQHLRSLRWLASDEEKKRTEAAGRELYGLASLLRARLKDLEEFPWLDEPSRDDPVWIATLKLKARRGLAELAAQGGVGRFRLALADHVGRWEQRALALLGGKRPEAPAVPARPAGARPCHTPPPIQWVTREGTQEEPSPGPAVAAPSPATRPAEPGPAPAAAPAPAPEMEAPRPVPAEPARPEGPRPPAGKGKKKKKKG